MSNALALRLLSAACALLEEELTANSYKGWETRREREQAVTVNIPPDLMSLWNRVKYQFKGTPEERLKAFLEYAHHHQDEGVQFLQTDADRKLNKLIMELKKRDKLPPAEDYPSSWDSV